jgi:hypothetical protein
VESVQVSPRFSCSGSISRHYARLGNRGARPINCAEALGNIYGNGSQACHLKGKTYRDAQLGELVHSDTVEHTLEHEVICGNEPVGEKCGEGETAGAQQLCQASGCEAATSLHG